MGELELGDIGYCVVVMWVQCLILCFCGCWIFENFCQCGEIEEVVV